MPGSKANRTKGNAKPSRSSKAAHLLSQPHSATVGLIGFEGFGGTHTYVPANQAFDCVSTCLDNDFRLILRKLTKRDAKTKIKSLGEFSALCKEKDDATLQAVLPFWPRLYNQLAIDVDAKVRECTQTAMTNLVGRVRRNLAPYLKNVMGAWILSQNDTYPTVATAAKKSFNTAFPPEKQDSAISFCRQAALEYIIDNLLNQTAATLSDSKTTENEKMESKLHRICIMSSSLTGLRQLLLALPTAHIDDMFKGQLRSLLNDGKFWNYSKSQAALVRIAFYWFLGSLCKTTPDVAGEYVRKLSPLILGSIDCIDPILTQAVWDAVLCLIKFVPACWDNINWQKAFWPKLRKVLESGCQGNAAIVAPNVLPLLECIPLEAAGGGSIFFPKVLELFRNGFSKDCVANSLSETNSWTRAFLECVQFSIRQISSEESSPILHSIFIDQLLPVIEASLFDSNPMLSQSQLYSSVSVLFRTTAGSPKTSKVVAAMWCSFCEHLCEMLETIGSEKEQSLHPERLVAFIKTALCRQDTSGHAGAKTEHVKFAKEVKRPCASDYVPADVFVSEEMKTLMKEVIMRSYTQYRRSRQCVHLKLFVDICNVYFPAEIAVCVLRSIQSETEIESGETTIENQESCVDPHGKLIDKVVLPVLAGKESAERSGEVVDHTISLLFACLPYLSHESSTRILDNVLEIASSTGVLCSLLKRASEKRCIMTHVTQWLNSTCVHSKLCQLVLRVTTDHSAMEPEELEQGWKLICLVLSANDDNEPVFPSSWIMKIMSRFHELVSMATHTLDWQKPEQVQTLIHFVARAVLIFFKNLKMSVHMREGCDLILALMMADLDTRFAASGDADSVLRQSWTTGLGLIIQQTGGLIEDGSVLASACHIILNTLLTRTQTMEQYNLVVEVTEKLLNTMQNHLPMGDDSEDEINGMVNPVMVALMSELFASPCIPQNDIVKVTDYHCLTGQLPLTVRGKNCVQRTENTSDMAATVFSSLFNLHLVRCFHSGFKFDKQPEFGEQSVWDGGEETVIVGAVRSLFVVTTWLKLESQIPPEVESAVEELTKMAHACFFSSSTSMQQKILTTAFSRIKDDVLMTLTFIQLAKLESTHQKKIDKDFFKNLYNSENPTNREFLETEAVAGYIPLWQASSVLEIQDVLLNSIGDNTSLADAASHVRILSLLLNAEPEHMWETYGEMIKAVLTKLKAIRDDDSTLFLFSCDVGEEHVNKMAFNLSVMQLLSVIVNCGDFYKLSSDHWDFILCSTVSWVESLRSSSMYFSSLKVQTFCVEICRLVTALSYTVQHRISENEAVSLQYLKTEWTKFVEEGIYSQLFPLCVTLLEELKETNKKGDVAVIVSALGSAMFHCPQQQITNHQLPLKLAASDDTSPIPESLQTILNYLCPVLTCPVAHVQVTAFVILDKIMNLLPSYLSKEENDRSSAASASSESVKEEIMSRSPPAVLMNVIEDGALAMDIVLDAVTMESSITLMPDSEEYQFALGYLLAWQLLLDFFHSADSAEQMKYTAYLKEHSYVSQLLTHLFCLMPSSPGSGSSPVRQMMEGSPSKSFLSVDNSSTPAKSHKHQTAETGGGDTWFSSSGKNLTPNDVGQPNDIQRVSCSVYLHCLNVMPVLVRQWWKDQDRKSAAYVDKFTTKYVSPHLIKRKMQSINSSKSGIEDLKVTASSLSREVTARYLIDEVKTEFKITLPENYPLGEISVNADRNVFKKMINWDRMLLQITVLLQHQGGNIMEGIRLWTKNIDKKFEGTEECSVCFAIFDPASMDLPKFPCRTCKKKFHNACLSQWIKTSQNTTCPLCRSNFLTAN